MNLAGWLAGLEHVFVTFRPRQRQQGIGGAIVVSLGDGRLDDELGRWTGGCGEMIGRTNEEARTR